MSQSERTKLIFLAVGLSLLLIVRDIFEIELSKWIYFAYLVFFFAIAQYRTLIYMLCFILPLLCGLPGTYIMLCALFFLILKKGNASIYQIIMIFLVAGMEIFASFWYPKEDIASLLQYISYASMMFFLIHDSTALDYDRCLRMYLYGTCFLCMVIITTGIMTAPSNWLTQFAKGTFRFGKTQMENEEAMRLVLNPNNLANYSVTGGCVGMLLADKSKGRQRLFYIVLALVASLGGVMSVSRSWLLVMALCLFLYILGKVRYPKRLVATVLFFGAVAFLVFGLMGDTTAILDAFTTRMEEDDVSTGNGRVTHFVAYMEAFLSNPRYILFGTGVTQYKAVTNLWGSMHNGTQQILVCCGISGFVVYLFGLLKPVTDICREGKRKMLYWIPWIGAVLYVQTTQFLNPMMLMLPYIVGVYALKSGEVKHEAIRPYG